MIASPSATLRKSTSVTPLTVVRETRHAILSHLRIDHPVRWDLQGTKMIPGRKENQCAIVGEVIL